MGKEAALFWSCALAALGLAGFLASSPPQPAPAAVPAPAVRTTAPARMAASPPHAGSRQTGRDEVRTILSAEVAWEARIDAYRRQLQFADLRGATAEERRRLLESHFSSEEQGRLEAYLAPQIPILTRQ